MLRKVGLNRNYHVLFSRKRKLIHLKNSLCLGTRFIPPTCMQQASKGMSLSKGGSKHILGVLLHYILLRVSILQGDGRPGNWLLLLKGERWAEVMVLEQF